MNKIKPLVKFIPFVLLLLGIKQTYAEIFTWPDQAKAAIVLTYDDTLNSHLDHAIPQLKTQHLTGTFYISGARAELPSRMTEWQQAAKDGNELANHTLYHPCQKSKPGRDWVTPAHDMDTYTLSQFISELKVTNTLLQAIDGETQRTFAYTCGDTEINGTSVVDVLKPLFLGARAVTDDGLNNPKTMDFHLVRSQSADNKTGQQLIAMAQAAQQKNQLMVFLFHGVGGDYLTVDNEAHQALLAYLSQHKSEYWVTTMRAALTFIQSNR
ncbi:MAG: polysaccharide deacetylase family protein [Thalassotalea sp.]